MASPPSTNGTLSLGISGESYIVILRGDGTLGRRPRPKREILAIRGRPHQVDGTLDLHGTGITGGNHFFCRQRHINATGGSVTIIGGYLNYRILEATRLHSDHRLHPAVHNNIAACSRPTAATGRSMTASACGFLKAIGVTLVRRCLPVTGTGSAVKNFRLGRQPLDLGGSMPRHRLRRIGTPEAGLLEFYRHIRELAPATSSYLVLLIHELVFDGSTLNLERAAVLPHCRRCRGDMLPSRATVQSGSPSSSSYRRCARRTPRAGEPSSIRAAIQLDFTVHHNNASLAKFVISGILTAGSDR